RSSRSGRRTPNAVPGAPRGTGRLSATEPSGHATRGPRRTTGSSGGRPSRGARPPTSDRPHLGTHDGRVPPDAGWTPTSRATSLRDVTCGPASQAVLAELGLALVGVVAAPNRPDVGAGL